MWPPDWEPLQVPPASTAPKQVFPNSSRTDPSPPLQRIPLPGSLPPLQRIPLPAVQRECLPGLTPYSPGQTSPLGHFPSLASCGQARTPGVGSPSVSLPDPRCLLVAQPRGPHTWDFSTEAVCLSHMGLISRPDSRSRSPCWKNSAMMRSVHRRYSSSGLVGLLRSAQCTRFCKTWGDQGSGGLGPGHSQAW